MENCLLVGGKPLTFGVRSVLWVEKNPRKYAVIYLKFAVIRALCILIFSIALHLTIVLSTYQSVFDPHHTPVSSYLFLMKKLESRYSFMILCKGNKNNNS